MDDTTRQLLNDAAPPVATSTDFDRLWRQAARQRRWQRAGQVAAALVLVALAGLALPTGGTRSLPLLGRADDGVAIDDEPVSAPLNEWDVIWTPGLGGGPVLSSGNPDYAMAVFAIDGGRWCVAAAMSSSRLDAAGRDSAVAQQLLCHELRQPAGSDPVGSVVAIRLGDRLVHAASVAVDRGQSGNVRADHGDGMEHVTDTFGVSGGGVPFGLWSTASIDESPNAFEFHSPTGQSAPVTIEAPEPVPAEVAD